MDGKPLMFQSLSGFQVRCNHPLSFGAAFALICFNPYRVFKFVATSLSCFALLGFSFVSIPIGFSSSLQLHGGAAKHL